LSLEITLEYGLPLVTCQLLVEDIRLPKMYLRGQRGYPRKGGAAYGFERPSLGWVGILSEVRRRFKNAIAVVPSSSAGVAAYLDAWAREATAVCEAEAAKTAEELKRLRQNADGGGKGGGQLKDAPSGDGSTLENAAGMEDLNPLYSVNLPADFAAAAHAPVIAF
jgi:hypothetical protein